MLNFTYLKLNLVTFLPPIVCVFFYFYKDITKNFKFIALSAFLGAVYFFIVDPFATVWGAWQFNYDRTIGINFGPSVVEELMWAILVFFVVGILVSVMGSAEEKNKSFKKLFKK
jgi:uncharacterized membrane protein